MYRFLRPALFKLDPENAHQLTLQLVRLAGYQPFRAILQKIYAAPEKPVDAFGLRFKNPVGLAAGYDKDGVAIRGLSALGFGHLEIGTVTPRPQPGNPRPRIFRLVEDEAVINRMGFPGKGAEYVSASLRGAVKGRRGNLSIGQQIAHLPLRAVQGSSGTEHSPRNDTIIGVNLGKNKDTPLEEAASDYITLIRQFIFMADFLTINISSPNTVGLRRLQGREMLEQLLGVIAKEREQIVLGRGGNAPILVKLAPDLSEEELDDAIDVILRTGMDGIIATNTTLAREGLQSKHQGETGGLSGKPLTARADEVLAQVVKKVGGRIPVVGVGGIMSPEDAQRKLDLGARLVQVYTGLVYAGPGLVKDIVKKLRKL
jgi:dihydroorotate dehydrogenase